MVAAVTVGKNGVAEMAYTGEKPWHGLGQSLKKGAPLEVWQTAAGMDWLVKRSRVRYGAGEQQQTWDQHHVLFRSDTKQPLGLVSKDYKIVQPKEVIEFYRDLCGEGGFDMETAGTLFDGRIFWALASVGDKASILDKADKVGGYLLLSTSADGTMKTTAKFTTVRVVCNNTLTMSLQGGGHRVQLSHRSVFDPNALKDQLGIARGEFSAFIKAAKQLAQITVADDKATKFVATLLTGDPKLNDEQTAKVATTDGYRKIMALFDGQAQGSQFAGVQGTAWGLVNAVTEYVDHHRGNTQQTRLHHAWFGAGDKLKTEALHHALAL